MKHEVTVTDEDSGITVTIPLSDDELASVADIQTVARQVFFSAIKSLEIILLMNRPKKLVVHVVEPTVKPPETVRVRLSNKADLNNIFLDSD